MTSRVDFGWKPTTTAIFRWNPSCGGERDPPDSIIFLKIEALILQSHCYPIDSVEKEGETVSPFPNS